MTPEQQKDMQKRLLYMLEAYDNSVTELIGPGNLGAVPLSYAIIDGEDGTRIAKYAFIGNKWEDRGYITTQDALHTLLNVQSELRKKLKDIGHGLSPLLHALINDRIE